MTFHQQVIQNFENVFGPPSRNTVKVMEWSLGPDISAVVQLDQPASGQFALVWLPYPEDGETVPNIALEYPAETGRHSGTYPASGLKKGMPALRLTLSSLSELTSAIEYIKAMRDSRPLPEVKADDAYRPSPSSPQQPVSLQSINGLSLPTPKPPAPRREAISRAVQREVWQRDAGRCVECGTREKLCFDHIVPYSRGGSNTIRNIQLLCEHCNGSKGNRI